MTRRDNAQRTPPDGQLRVAVITVGLFFGVALVVGIGALFYALLGQGSGEPPGPPRAAIVDQLSLTFPNPAFSEEATQMLETAGYTVDYYPGEEVTVDFYRDLPTHDYDLVVLRIHAARHENVLGGEQITMAELFTSEAYSSTKHAWEQEQGQIGSVAYEQDGEAYFGIGPAFVVESMRGEFDGATVIMMGCNGLISDVMAEAFIRKGAETFVSWDDLVSAEHTDAAILSMLEHMLLEDLPARDAAAAAMAEVGPDPYYDSNLLSYPLED